MVLNYLVNRIYEVHAIQEKIKHAEKSRLPILIAEAKSVFSECIEKFDTIQREANFSLGPNIKEHPEIIVSLSEAAVYTENFETARRLVVDYFLSNPLKDQYYCRAKIMKGLIINFESRDLKGAERLQSGEKAIKEMIEALDIATAPANLARYKFIVYNVSVSAWSVIRPFLRPGRAKAFATPLQSIVTALEQQDDPDRDWRITLLSAAAACFEDAQNTKAASDNVDKAVGLVEGLLAETIGQQAVVDKELNECKKVVEAAMNAFREIEEREETLRKPKKIDPDLPPDDPYYTTPVVLPPLQGLAADGKEKVRDMLDLSQAKRTTAEARLRTILDRKTTQTELLIRLCRQRVGVNLADSKKFATGPNIVKDLRLSSLVQLQCILSGGVPEKELDATWQGLFKKLSDAAASDLRTETLLDVTRTAWGSGQIANALKGHDILKQISVSVSPILRVKTDLVDALLAAHHIDEEVVQTSRKQLLNQSQLSGLAIQKRLEVIKSMERTLNMAVQVARDKFLVQEIASLMWNLLVPCLTQKLRSRVHSVLKTMCVALETVQAVSPELRSHLHYELSLCEESADFASLALIEVRKAYGLDFGVLNAYSSPKDRDMSLDGNRPPDQYLLPWLHSLALRTDVFASPSHADAQALLWLQQAKESQSKPFVKDMCAKAAVLLFENLDDLTGSQGAQEAIVGGVVDWALVLMKRGAISHPPVALEQLQSLFPSTETSSSPAASLPTPTFSFPLYRKMQLLITLARLAQRAEEVHILQTACFHLLKWQWPLTELHAAYLVDDQIEAACLLAESFAARIQQSRAREAVSKTSRTALVLTSAQGSTSSLSTAEMSNGSVALGIQAKQVSPEVLAMKVLVIQALEQALTLALARRDAFHVQNVVIYFWNLHLHIFRQDLYDLVLPDVYRALGKCVQALEAMLGFPDVQSVFDIRLFVNVFDAHVAGLESRGLSSEGLEVSVKCLNTLSLPVPTSSSTAAFFKKGLCERASRLQVLAALKGQGGAPAGGKGKGGPVLEPLAITNNALLSAFSCLAVADLDDAGLPAEVSLEAQNKALKLVREDVMAQVQAEEKDEMQGATSRRRREVLQQRVELRMEAMARLSRLLILRADFIAGQSMAEEGIKLFDSFRKAIRGQAEASPQKGDEGKKEGEDEEDADWEMLGEEDDSLEGANALRARCYRWASLCEQNSALALLAFLETSLKAPGSATFDPDLISRLQIVALTHLQPAAQYAVRSNEAVLIHRSAQLACSLLPSLLATADVAKRAFRLGMAIVVDLGAVELSLSTQAVLRGLFLALAGYLAASKDYDSALKLIMQAFDQLHSSLHRELWPLRVVCMSRKGLNVLDGLQKLKERDPLLQAQVLALFARATTDLATRINAYQQAIDLLEGRIERVDYVLELVEVVGSEGFPMAELRALLRNALDTYCEVEEQRFEEVRDWEEGDDEELGLAPSADKKGTRGAGTAPASRQKARSVASATSKRHPGQRSAPPSVKGSNTARSQAGRPTPGSERGGGGGGVVSEEKHLPTSLDFKGLEQCARLWVMYLFSEVDQEERQAHMLRALYYLRRALELWQTTVQEAEAAGQPASPSGPLPADPFQLIKWQGMFAFCQQTKALAAASTASKGSPPVEAALLLPSPRSLPFLSATVHYLDVLSQELEANGLFSQAMLVLAFLKMILWTASSPSDNGVTAFLSAIFLRASQLCCRMGLGPAYLSEENFVLSPDQSSTIALGVAVDTFIARNQAEHVQADISPDLLLDISFEDVLRHHQQQRGQGGGLALRRPAHFLETTPWSLPSLDRLDEDYYWTRVCELLVSFSQPAAALRLAVVLLYRCRLQKKIRNVAEIATVLAEVFILQGRDREVMAWLLAQRALLAQIGDPLLLLSQTRCLLRTYLRRGMLQEAKETSALLVHLLKDLSIRAIECAPSSGTATPAGAGTHALPSTTSKTTLRQGNSVTTLGASLPSSSALHIYKQQEVSWDGLCAWKEAVLLAARVQLQEILEKLRETPAASSSARHSQDLRSLFSSMLQQLDAIQQVLVQHMGKEAGSLLDIWETRIRLSWVFLTEFHRLRSSSVPLDEYNSWVEGVLGDCLRTAQLVLAASQRRVQSTQQLELLPGQPEAVAATAVASTAQTNADAWRFHAKQILASASEGAEGQGENGAGRSLLHPAVRQAALAQIFLAAQFLWMDSFVHIAKPFPSSSSVVKSLREERPEEGGGEEGGEEEPNPVDRFLAETAPPVFVGREAFQASFLSQAAQWSSSALLSFPGHELRNVSPRSAQLVYLTAQVSQGSRQQSSSSSSSSPVLVAAQQEWREALEQVVQDLVDSEDADIVSLLPFAVSALVESHARHTSSRDAVCRYVLLLQSLAMRQWLQATWLSALPITCEAFSANQRLRALRSQRHPGVEAWPQYQADKTFLAKLSAATRKLSLSLDVEQAIQAVATPSTVVIAIQSCPWQRTLYATAIVPLPPDESSRPAGAAAPSQAAPTANSKAAASKDPGPPPVVCKRFVDKLLLSEASRRQWQTLLEQHRAWRQDAVKFTALYGEDLAGEDDDLEEVSSSVESTRSSTVAQKAERALEERLRALLQDMQDLLDPLLGSSSLIATALATARNHASQSLQCLLLVDPWLQSLPFEGLDVFDSADKLSLGRDFSLHLFVHRSRQSSPSATPPPAATTATPAAAVGVPTVASSAMRLIHDPWQEDPSSTTTSSSSSSASLPRGAGHVIKQSIASLPGGSKWTPLRTIEQGLVSVHDFLLAVESLATTTAAAGGTGKASMGLFAYSLGRLGSLFPPADVCTANLERLQILFCLDQTFNDASFRRQNSADVVKTPQDVALETPLTMTALFSLAGTGCIVHQAWSTSNPSQRRFSRLLLSHWATKKESIGLAVQNSRQESREGQVVRVKKWIRLARQVYGLPSVMYQDA